jgi:hypothetical protein
VNPCHVFWDLELNLNGFMINVYDLCRSGRIFKKDAKGGKKYTFVRLDTVLQIG